MSSKADSFVVWHSYLGFHPPKTKALLRRSSQTTKLTKVAGYHYSCKKGHGYEKHGFDNPKFGDERRMRDGGARLGLRHGLLYKFIFDELWERIGA